MKRPAGFVEAQDGETIASVSVSAGAESVAATVEEDGSWRAEGIAIPSPVDEFNLQVTAIDSADVEGSAQTLLSTSLENIGSGED